MAMHMKRPEVACVGPECEGCSSPKCMSKGGECSGPSCEGCSSPDCMAEGGEVNSGKQRSDNEKGVHKSPYWQLDKGKSMAGTSQRAGNTSSGEDKQMHREITKEEHQGVLSEMRSMKKPKLMAKGGMADADMDGMAAGPDGDSEEGLSGGLDDDLKEALGSELCSAFEAKDKKRIMDGIEAVVLSVLSKG